MKKNSEKNFVSVNNKVKLIVKLFQILPFKFFSNTTIVNFRIRKKLNYKAQLF